MRTTLVVALLLASSAVAFMPSAVATPPCMPEEPCDPPPYQPPTPDCRKVPDKAPLVVVADDCKVVVSVDYIDCLWGEQWVTYTVGPVTVRYTTCSGPYESMQAAPPCTCPPPVVQPCDAINDLVADVDDGVDWTLSDSCRPTVVIDLTRFVSCIWGHDAYLYAGPVTVVYPVCESPCGGMTCPSPIESTMMADPFPTCVRECSPVPMDACQLRDATPGPLVHPLWGYDCTVDVHTACLGGASDSYDARVGFVDVSIAKCSGPAWS